MLPEIAAAGDAGVTDVRQDLTWFDAVFGLSTAQLRVMTRFAGASSPNWRAEAYVTTADMLRAEGKAEDILLVFEQRGIDVEDKSRELIESCTNLDTLNGWFRRAFKVDNASGLFAE